MVPVPEFYCSRVETWQRAAVLIGSAAWLGSCGGDKRDSGLTCPTWGDPVAVAGVETDGLAEASGLVVSPQHAGVLWTHNDDGDADGELYALALDGSVQGTLTLQGASPVDWEAVAVRSTGTTSQLVIGDVGDNDANRDRVAVLMTPEPETLSESMDAAVVERIEFTLPGGAVDVEGMLVDPSTGRLLLFTRAADRTEVFAVDLSEATPEPDRVAFIDLDGSVYAGLGSVRGADVSSDGSVVLRLTDGVVWFPGAGSAVDAIQGSPCLVPSPPEQNGEAVAVVGEDLYFIGEGNRPDLWRVARGVS